MSNKLECEDIIKFITGYYAVPEKGIAEHNMFGDIEIGFINNDDDEISRVGIYFGNTLIDLLIELDGHEYSVYNASVKDFVVELCKFKEKR